MNRAQQKNFTAVFTITILLILAAFFVGQPLYVQAQNSGNITVTQNGAKLAYGNGVEFKISTVSTGNQPAVTSAKIKIRYGTRGQEETYDATLSSGTAQFFASEDKTQLVTGMPLTWTWIMSNGKLNFETPPQVVTYEDQRHRWVQREGDKVTVRWYSGDDAYGALMYQLAADSLATYKRRFNMETTQQIYITIYDSRAAFFTAFPEHPSWAGGFARYGGQEIVVISPQAQNEGVLIGEGIPHELSHAALFQFLGRPAPVWLDEGFAVYNQNIIAIREYDEILQQAYKKNALLPFATLNNRWPMDEISARLAYAQGRSFITFMLNNYGNEVWSNVLDGLRRGDANSSFEENFGITLAEMEEMWREKELGRNKSITLPAARKRGPVPSQPSRLVAGSPVGAVTPNKPSSNDSSGLLVGSVAAVFSLAVAATVGLLIFSRRRRTTSDYVYEDVLLTNRLSAVAGSASHPSSVAPTYNYNQYPPVPTPLQPPLPNYNPTSGTAAWPQPTNQYNPPYYSQNYQPIAPPYPSTPVPNSAYYSQTPVNNNNSNISVPNPAPPAFDDPFDFIMQNFGKKAASTPPPSIPNNLADPYGLNSDLPKKE